jgi:hypothetical protein
MADEHRPAVPNAIEDVIEGLAELGNVLGEAARDAVAVVRAKLTDAMAARDRGDPVATMRAIGEAMERLARVADRLDPQEAVLMRAIAGNFQKALLRGDLSQAKQDLGVMFDRSGARERKKD